MADKEKKPMVDITNLTDEELNKLDKGVLRRILKSSSNARKIESNLEETSHDKHSSFHSKD